jgi:outer membrane protein assembly factor BamB
MKKILAFAMCYTWFVMGFAQQDFALAWKGQFPVKTEVRMINQERTMALGGNFNEIAMMDLVAGKVLWQIKFKDKINQKKVLDFGWDEEANAVWAKAKGDNKNEVITYHFNEMDGSILSKDAYEIQKTKNKKSKYRYKGMLEVDDTYLVLNYEKKMIVSSAGKGKKAELEVQAVGKKNWSTKVQGKYVRTLCANSIPSAASMFGGDFLRLMYAKNKVFLIYEGMSVLDFNTGKLLWQIDLDNTELDFGVFKSTQVLGRAGYPQVDETGVYVADLTKDQYCIKKYDLETGALIWKSPSFDKDFVVPDMKVFGNLIVAQFGGMLEMQSYIPGTNGRPDVCKSEYKFTGDAGVKAYDKNTGKVVWETSNMKSLGDKFNGAITNILVHGSLLYVASDKQIYAFDEQGTAKFIVPVKTVKLGKPKDIHVFKSNTLVVLCEKGIASLDLNDGKIIFATNTKKAFDYQYKEDAFFVWTGKAPGELNEFMRLDLTTGKVLGKIKNVRYPHFTPNGAYFIKFDGAKIFKYNTI